MHTCIPGVGYCYKTFKYPTSGVAGNRVVSFNTSRLFVLRRYSSTSTKVVKIPGVLRIKDLAKLLKMPIQKVVTLYRKHPLSSPFEHHSKIILPFTIAEDIAKGVGKISEYNEIDVFPSFNKSYGNQFAPQFKLT